MELALFVIGILILATLYLGSDKMLRKSRVEDPPVPKVRQPKPGECPHTSNRGLKVTSMGDREDYYLCRLCGKKVKASELYHFEKGGIW